ncbi:MAG: hypothetical protein AABX47_03005 [Nanoarchaeota archaeon]
MALEVDRASQNANNMLNALLSGEVTLDEIKKYITNTPKRRIMLTSDTFLQAEC